MTEKTLPFWKRIIKFIGYSVSRDSLYPKPSITVFEPEEEREPEEKRNNGLKEKRHNLSHKLTTPSRQRSLTWRLPQPK